MLTSEKQQLKNCFNKAVHSYDKHCHVQQQTGARLINMISCHKISHHTIDSIIDVGCGTGLITEKLIHHFPRAKLIAIDIADQLLRVAYQKLFCHEIQTYIADYDAMPFRKHSFQLVFSNMALQWSRDLSHTIKEMTRIMSSNGWLAFSIPLPGTFTELPRTAVNQFLSATMIMNILRDYHYEPIQYAQEKITTVFQTPTAALRSIKNTGANYLTQKNNIPRLGRHIILINPSSLGYTLTYQIGFFMARKK